jgi:predicted DNA-binding transcriptional regulator AlpA
MTDTCVAVEAPARMPVLATNVKTSNLPRRQEVDLSAIPWNCPFAMLNEYQAGAVLGLGVKVLRRRRADGTGPKYVKLNGFSIRYKLADLQAWLASQPTGGGAAPGARERRGPGRPRRTV